MTASKNCYDLLKHYEGCKLTAYLDVAKVPTIGYGNTMYLDGRRVKEGDTITQTQAELLLPSILEKFEISVRKALKVNITQQQYDAIVCLTYNIGIGNFVGSSLLRKINASDPLASDSFLLWNKAKINGVLQPVKGLTYRRQSEKYLYDNGVVKWFN